MKNFIFLCIVPLLLLTACTGSDFEEEFPVVNEPEIVNEELEKIPCDYDFNVVGENDTLNIACSHDLLGETIVLPKNVFFNYNGGEIINGTLEFDEGIIDGDLLNHKLTVKGSVKLESSTFIFEKSRWGITEGEVSDAIALINKETFQKVINDTKLYGAEIFQIDELDAFFLVTSERNLVLGFETSIRLPSDFTLEMTDNTDLRVQPNRYIRYQFLNIRGEENVNIDGGNLHGDRDYHDYTPITVAENTYSSHEWGHLISIEGGQNVKITNVHLAYASGDGIDIHGINFTYNPDYIASKNITISDCVFDSNRRNNLSITDGYDMIIENNTFLNAGIDTPLSKGTAPRMALDIEATRTRDSEGNLVYYQRAYDIIIRNNIEKGSGNASFYVAIGEDVTIVNNTSEKAIGWGLASGVKVKENIITSLINSTSGIIGGRPGGNGTIFGNEISGNIVKGFVTGIRVNNVDLKVYENEIENCIIGIALGDLDNADIYDNSISTERDANCYGIYAHIGSLDDVRIQNNKIEVSYKPIAFTNVNLEEGHEDNIVTLKDNDLNGGEVHISNSNGIVEE
ncbi:right-handed parallel beta-helix repeat-containing protein [Labilibaculum antarcticum]|uniref:Right handed beta helix domain-containing protein n=1 Tax=Labilibaculum antarcticum TaxID=1717717 RepID=A0A1Y1CRQ2_9BACT|nr:right-handed parallel beta-helix repeat-containing protein [Labilibaculum antarcticum]BAX82612.1 hypothetical protein ALGA_4322 [Labilibaculum antarcticum]